MNLDTIGLVQNAIFLHRSRGNQFLFFVFFPSRRFCSYCCQCVDCRLPKRSKKLFWMPMVFNERGGWHHGENSYEPTCNHASVVQHITKAHITLFVGQFCLVAWLMFAYSLQRIHVKVRPEFRVILKEFESQATNWSPKWHGIWILSVDDIYTSIVETLHDLGWRNKCSVFSLPEHSDPCNSSFRFRGLTEICSIASYTQWNQTVHLSSVCACQLSGKNAQTWILHFVGSFIYSWQTYELTKGGTVLLEHSQAVMDTVVRRPSRS